MIREILIYIKESIFEHVKHRLFFVSLLFIVLFSVLVLRLFNLQIKNGEKYQNNFTYKSVKTVTVEPSRGNIYDCNGKLIAYNESSYAVSYVSDTDLTSIAKKMDMTVNQLRNQIVYKTILILEQNGDSLSVDLPIKLNDDGSLCFTISGTTLNTFLMNVYGASSVDSLTDAQKNSTAKDVYDYMRSSKLFDVDDVYSPEYVLKILAVRYEIWLNRYQQYMSVDIATDVSKETYAAILESKDELYGMNVNIESHRVYNDAVYFAHIIGYIGNISSEEMDEYNKNLDDKNKYDMSDVVGKMGIEKQFESQLRGTTGSQKMYVDNMGKILEIIDSTDAVAGNDIYLTIDSDLQKYCYNALEQEISSILLSHLRNETFAVSDDDITIMDVYAALFDNNIISIDNLSAADASELERSVYQSFSTAKANILNQLDSILKVNHTPVNGLTDEYKDYMEYIFVMLKNKGIYDNTIIPSTDRTYINYADELISAYDYLKYCISKGAIDISSISTSSNYYDTDEIYDVLADYILEEFKDDTDFDKLIFKYMLLSGQITGADVIDLLYDQGILTENGDTDYANFKSGLVGSYDFMYNKIKNLEITPAMLALDPCSGSIVVTDPATGELRAMVSYPSYDNNLLTNTIDPDYYAKVTNDKTTPMYNRATMQKTAPGSTFKIITSVAALEENLVTADETIHATGIFEKTEDPAKCWIYPMAHGDIAMARAIEESCNYYFYEMGYRMGTSDTGTFKNTTGIKIIQKYAEMFGLNTTSGIELPESDPHISDSDAIRSAIGQGNHNYTATQIARYVTAVANEGTVYDLSLVSEIKDNEGNSVYKDEHTVYNQIDIPASDWKTIKQGMRQVVSVHTDKDTLINKINVEVAGKTGTAQEDKTRPNHALFISFAPYSNPKVCVTTVIPNGYSSGNAEELAAMVYAYMYDPDALENMTVTGNNQMSD